MALATASIGCSRSHSYFENLKCHVWSLLGTLICWRIVVQAEDATRGLNDKTHIIDAATVTSESIVTELESYI